MSLRIDRPATSGSHALESLHAQVCERLEIAESSDRFFDVCGDAHGTIDFRLG